MGTFHNVLHVGAKPIDAAEFRAALHATCTPRFPKSRSRLPRPVALAISGGVDSMALAFLCHRARRADPNLQVCDHPVKSFQGFIVDHRLREGSAKEALSVSQALRAIGLESQIFTLNWPKLLGSGQNPNDLPNLESMARRFRYQRLGRMVAMRKISSLLLGHHSDDQYETVLMRILNGHNSRGLRGMRRAWDIPECEGIHGVHQSGFVDDQYSREPLYNHRVSKRQRRELREELRSTIDKILLQEELQSGSPEDLGPEGQDTRRAISLELDPVDIEDGGVSVYRPLLDFSKDRLIATCLANGVPWWEDHTNSDPTLTTRNAIRYMLKNHELPRALQKPAILQLAHNCDLRARAQEQEATRLIPRTTIHDFEPHVGTAIVEFPELRSYRLKRFGKSERRRRARIVRERTIAGLLIQRLIALVSPDLPPPPLANLQNVVSRLFPSLAQDTEAPPKAFSIAGVHFMPIQAVPTSAAPSVPDRPLTWHLSRQPYPATQRLPQWRIPYWSADTPQTRKDPSQRFVWSKWSKWHLYDGRFWFRVSTRLPCRVVILPYLREHAKSLRESLQQNERARMEAGLKRYAPGKVRYTLPAIYLEEDLDLAAVETAEQTQPSYPTYAFGTRLDWHTYHATGKGIDFSKLKILTLPTLGIQIPGLDDWLQYDFRYKRADPNVLESIGRFYSPLRGAVTPTSNRVRVRVRSRRSRTEAGRKKALATTPKE